MTGADRDQQKHVPASFQPAYILDIHAGTQSPFFAAIVFASINCSSIKPTTLHLQSCIRILQSLISQQSQRGGACAHPTAHRWETVCNYGADKDAHNFLPNDDAFLIYIPFVGNLQTMPI